MKIGIIGGGQLCKLFIEHTKSNNIFYCYSPTKPLNEQCIWVKGNLNDKEDIINFGLICDIITIEIENINIDGLEILKKVYDKKIYPDPTILKIIQNKKSQKEILIKYGFPVAQTCDPEIIKYPCVNKLQIGGYDGYGVKILQSNDDSQFTEPSILEEYISIDRELAIIVARNNKNDTVVLPLTEMKMKNNKLDYLLCQVQIHDADRFYRMAKDLVYNLQYEGVLAIEFFYTKDDKIYINEISPRVHNSGHYSIDYMNYNQFDLLLRCITDQELIQPEIKYNKNIYMLNIIATSNINKCSETIFFNHKSDKLYDYKKTSATIGRKMGHLTSIVSKENNMELIRLQHAILWETDVKTTPIVAIIMGSLSDYEIMKPAVDILKAFQVPYIVKIVSAHRTPNQMVKFTLELNTIKIIIAGAGGAAHLPGMIASLTTIPVIGVPINSSNSIQGIDSLLSIVQMPNGVPVATMAIGSSKNAGLYALRILGINDIRIANLLKIYQRILEEQVDEMNEKLNNM